MTAHYHTPPIPAIRRADKMKFNIYKMIKRNSFDKKWKKKKNENLTHYARDIFIQIEIKL